MPLTATEVSLLTTVESHFYYCRDPDLVSSEMSRLGIKSLPVLVVPTPAQVELLKKLNVSVRSKLRS